MITGARRRVASNDVLGAPLGVDVDAHPVAAESVARAVRAEASRYPGQEQQVLEFFRKNPQAAENLRAPIFEEKVVDFMLELAKVNDRQVTPEELSAAVA